MGKVLAKILFLLAFCGLGVAGCSSTRSKPGYLDDPRTHPKYQPSRFLTCVGTSAQSKEDAEARAKKGIAEQIKSKIVSVTEAVEREVDINGKARFSGEYKSQIKVEADFSHAELIGIDPSAGGLFDGCYYGFAFLSVADFEDAVNRDYEQQAPRYRQALQNAESAQELPTFSAALRLAADSFMVMQAKALELRAVIGRAPEAFQNDEHRWRSLVAEKTKRLGAVKIAVSAQNNGEEGAAEKIVPLLTKALSMLGLSSTAGLGNPGDFCLTFSVKTHCEAGSFGPRCSLSLPVRLTACRSESVLVEADLSDPSFVGSSPNDEKRALQKMWLAVSEQALAAKIKATMSAVLPID